MKFVIYKHTRSNMPDRVIVAVHLKDDKDETVAMDTAILGFDSMITQKVEGPTQQEWARNIDLQILKLMTKIEDAYRQSLVKLITVRTTSEEIDIKDVSPDLPDLVAKLVAK